MFEVLVSAIIKDSDEGNAIYRNIQLPFPPFNGLKLFAIVNPDSEHEITSVIWNMRSNSFEAEIEALDWIDMGDGIHPDWWDGETEQFPEYAEADDLKHYQYPPVKETV